MLIDQCSFPANLLMVCNALRNISEQLEPEKLYATLLQAALEQSGACRGYLLSRTGEALHLIAEVQVADAGQNVHIHHENGRSPAGLPMSILQQSLTSSSQQVIADAALPHPFSGDAALCDRHVKSVSCLPWIRQDVVVGLLYLEHNLTPHLFTAEKMTVLNLLLAQAAATLEHAQRHSRLLEETNRLHTVDQDLAFQRNLLRTLVESVPHRIYAKDSECRFTFANLAVAKGMGLSSSDALLGKTDFGFYPDESAAQYMAEEKQIMQSGIPMVDQEEHVQYLLTDDMAWMLTNKMLLRDNTGNVVGIVGINYDITERKQMELELVRRNAELLDLTSRLAQTQQQLV